VAKRSISFDHAYLEIPIAATSATNCRNECPPLLDKKIDAMSAVLNKLVERRKSIHATMLRVRAQNVRVNGVDKPEVRPQPVADSPVIGCSLD
jgi:hypothetical protein